MVPESWAVVGSTPKSPAQAMDMHEDNSQLRHLLPAESAASRPLGRVTPEPGPPSASKHPKRRAPITNVACQECRKRKTKCDGVKPACSNCSKRGITHCLYDTEGTQSSKIAFYRSKITTQTTRIAELESENLRLQDATSRANSSTPSSLSLPAPFQAKSMGASHQQPSCQASISSVSRSVSSSSSILNPMRHPGDDSSGRLHAPRLPQEEHSSRFGPLRQHDTETAFSPAETRTGCEDELAVQQQQNVVLKNENDRLKEIMVFLIHLDDRSLAELLAARIREEGLTDDILAQVNTMFAVGRGNATQKRGPPLTNGHSQDRQQNQQVQNGRPFSQMSRLPALSSLDLPSLTAPSTPDLDLRRQNGTYVLPPLGSHKTLREGW